MKSGWPAALVDTKSISRWNPLFWLFDVIENAMYRRSDLVASTLSKVHDHVVEKGGSMERILIVPNGIDRSVLSRAERMSEDESRELPRFAEIRTRKSFSMSAAMVLTTM